MSRNIRRRNNTLAGFFVLATILAFVGVVITLSNINFLWGTREIEVSFPMDLGVPGLAKGSDVTLGQMKIGSVTTIRARHDAASRGLAPEMIVTITIPDSHDVRKDAKVALVVPLLGSGTSINFESFGTGEALGPSDRLKGDIASPVYLRAAGIGNAEIERIRQTIQNVEEITTFFNEHLAQEGESILTDVSATTADVREVVALMKERWPEWTRRVDSLSDSFVELSEQGKSLVEEARTFVNNTDNRLAKVETLIDEVTPDVRRVAASAANTAEEIERVTLPEMSKLLQEGQARVTEAGQSIALLNETLAVQLPEVGRILGNMRIASDNLKLAMIEIRSAPWRLLAKPSDMEMQESLQRDAVRTYANAVSDLAAATASLRNLQETYGSTLSPDSPVVSQVLEQLQESFDRYQEAERQWFEILLSQ